MPNLLSGWSSTQLWFTVGVRNPRTHIVTVWYPTSISREQRLQLLEAHVTQMISLIRELTGTKAQITHGQYAEVPVWT